MTRLAPLFALAFALAPVTAAPVPKAVKRAESIVGEWREVTPAPDGQPTESATGYTWRFEADLSAAVVWPDGTLIPAEYRLDPEGVVKGYDWTLTRHNTRFVGVYELSGDVLRTATVSAGKERPTEVKPGANVEYRTYVRVKPGK